MDVIDLPCVGGRFTRLSGNGHAMSRLDRFLLSDNLISLWKLDNQVVDKRVLSDHSHVWLKSGGSDWGSKPFRFNNGWYKHKDFDSFVRKEWSLMTIKGKGDYALYEKLKSLKLTLKEWNKEVFGWLDLRIKEKIDEQHELDQFLILNAGGDASGDVEARRVAADVIWNKLELKEGLLRQKSEPCKVRPFPIGIDFKRLEVEVDARKECPFTADEIKQAIWNYDGYKMPGPG
ncbi:uncharacterized protein LOC131653012 [Vicia villosa]|uniref:uncharacterized protein LOC131653012 n=1 Tax=Vicia villosa TaxID=3911 RepID=UPI00273ABB61|nr:uncharacterized protein LOC131653012 [Vicia villosa]